MYNFLESWPGLWRFWYCFVFKGYLACTFSLEPMVPWEPLSGDIAKWKNGPHLCAATKYDYYYDVGWDTKYRLQAAAISINFFKRRSVWVLLCSYRRCKITRVLMQT